MKVDGDGESILGNDFTKGIHRGRGLEASKARSFAIDVDINELFTDHGAGVTHGVDDASPVRVISIP